MDTAAPRWMHALAIFLIGGTVKARIEIMPSGFILLIAACARRRISALLVQTVPHFSAKVHQPDQKFDCASFGAN